MAKSKCACRRFLRGWASETAKKPASTPFAEDCCRRRRPLRKGDLPRLNETGSQIASIEADLRRAIRTLPQVREAVGAAELQTSDRHADHRGLLMIPFTLDPAKRSPLRFRIDSFSVPAAARTEFEAAMRRNLGFIRTLPGFLSHTVFEKASGPSTYNIVTIAIWESPEAIAKAADAVRAYYEEIGFNPAEVLSRLGVAAEIGQYQILDEAREQGAA